MSTYFHSFTYVYFHSDWNRIVWGCIDASSPRGILRGKVGAVEAEETAEVSRLFPAVAVAVGTVPLVTVTTGSTPRGVRWLRGVGSFRRGSTLLPLDRPVSPITGMDTCTELEKCSCWIWDGRSRNAQTKSSTKSRARYEVYDESLLWKYESRKEVLQKS